MNRFRYLRDREDDEGVEPKALERANIVRGYGTCVPYQFPASHNQRLPRHVRHPKLQPQVAEVHRVYARPEHRHYGRQPTVHVQARCPTSSYRQRVEEQRVHRQRHPPCQQERSVPTLHALASWVQHLPEWSWRWPSSARVSAPVLYGC